MGRVNLGYRPFSKKVWIDTEHGIINPEEYRYFTKRKPEHVFKKFRGFGISLSEIELMEKHNVSKIIIKYFGKFKNTIYGLDFRMLRYFQEYDNDGDIQKVIPIKDLEVIGYEEGKGRKRD